jgi:hypothetical protein
VEIPDRIGFLENVRYIPTLLKDSQHESDASGIGGMRLAAGYFEFALPRSL